MDPDHTEDTIRALLGEARRLEAPVARLGRLPRLSDDAADEASRSEAALGAAELLIALDQTARRVTERHGKTGSALLWGVLGSREAVASSHIENEGTSLTFADMRRVIQFARFPTHSADDVIGLMRFSNSLAVDVLAEVEIKEGDWLAQEKTSVLRCSAASRWLLTAGASLYDTHRAHQILCFGRDEVRPGMVRGDGANVTISDQLGRVVFAPPKGGADVMTMLKELVDWTAGQCNKQKEADDVERYAHRVAVSGIAHLRFESIHPFLDGNGRIGRSFAEAIIASARPHHHHVLPIGIASAFSDRRGRSTYYAALDRGREEQTDFAVWWCEQVEQAAAMAIDEIAAATDELARASGRRADEGTPA